MMTVFILRGERPHQMQALAPASSSPAVFETGRDFKSFQVNCVLGLNADVTTASGAVSWRPEVIQRLFGGRWWEVLIGRNMVRYCGISWLGAKPP